MTGQEFVVLEDVVIPIEYGIRLRARIWMPPDAAEIPVPAILEFLPYRRRDGTAARDESIYPDFARAGYAGVRVDLRGHGDSDGLIEDEYSPQELADAVEVIGWITEQAWCTGVVGMMGISWGGFNSLQVAALRPSALKAVISLSTSTDRYNDDIHYKNGCHLAANFYWSATMLSYGSRPPDPNVVGEVWRSQWLSRLEKIDLPLLTWVAHQRRDRYWEHGSVGDDWNALAVPILAIGGWADGYRNAPPDLAAHLATPVKAINGPWIHKYPHFAWPKPRLDFHAEAVRWWDRWLKGVRNGADSLPAYRAYLSEKVPAGIEWRSDEPGNWVALDEWPSTDIQQRVLYFTDKGTLSAQPNNEALHTISTPQDCGISSGEYFTLKPDAELAGDQRKDDADSFCLETGPLDQALDILGRPIVELDIAIDQEYGNLAVRLVDVHADGTCHRVSLGVMNLAHREGNHKPCSMKVGQLTNVTIRLDETGHCFQVGHRIRVAISTTYWPYILPPPFVVTATLKTGDKSALHLPVLTHRKNVVMPEPASTELLPDYTMISQAVSSRIVEKNLATDITRFLIHEDTGLAIHPENGIRFQEIRRETWQIHRNDPLSLKAEAHMTAVRSRDSWHVQTEVKQTLSVDESSYFLGAKLEAYEGGQQILRRKWKKAIKRDFT
jgi:putative CocE/NonD family hydrolase